MKGKNTHKAKQQNKEKSNIDNCDEIESMEHHGTN